MTTRRVLQVIGGGEIGGAENHLLNLMRLLMGSDYEPVLVCLCPGPFAERAAEYGITTYTVPMAHHFDISKIKAVQDIIDSNNIDLVHTHGVRANLVARPAACRSGVPVVTTFHSSLQHDYNNRMAAVVARLVTKMTNKYTDRYIAVSAAIKDYMLTLGIPDREIEVIYNGINTDIDHTRYSCPELRQALGLPADAAIIGTVGRLHQVKGHFYLLDAACRLINDFPSLLVIIVGDGPEACHYPAAIAERGLAGRVIMPGYCQDVYEFYAVMDAFCLPSLMEGQGLVLLEAMNAGVPVIASRVGGVPEVITDGVNGSLVPPADPVALASAIKQVLSNPELAHKLIVNGRANVARFSLANMANQTRRVYDSILGLPATNQ